MFAVKVLSIFVALMYSDQAASDGCVRTKFRIGQLNNMSLLLLSDMAHASSPGDHFPVECLKEKVERMFPEDLYKNAQRDGTVVALKTFEHWAQIFSKDLTSVSWDTDKLKLFTNHISRQIEKLKQCVMESRASYGHGGQLSTISASLRAYFDKLNGLLKEKEYSACAWETVRAEIRYNLLQFKTFLES